MGILDKLKNKTINAVENRNKKKKKGTILEMNPEGKDAANDVKEIKPAKQRKKLYVVLTALIIVAFVFYAAIVIVQQNVQISEKRSELKGLQQQINLCEIQTQYLEQVLNYKGADLEEYIKKVASDEGYVTEGERIFINVAGN